MLTLLFSLRDCFRARAALQAEILALRHQLLVLQRSSRPHKLRLGWADRVLWVWLSRLWTDWRSALLIVKPETVVAWHRRGFRLYWTWKSRRCEGRPTASPEVRNLIRQMSLANPRWGAPRIHGELLKLGIQISQGTVAKLCFATILSALKIARFPAATAVPSRLSLHPRAPRISPGRTPAVYLYIVRMQEPGRFRDAVGSD